MTRSIRCIITIMAIGLLACGPNAGATAAAETSHLPIIHTRDVTRFYKLYDAAHGHPTAAQLQRDYLDPGSEGLHHLAKLRHVTGKTIAATLARNPQIYADAKRCMAVLPQVRTRLHAAFRKLVRLYPQADLPPVTIAVGHGKPVGVTDASGVMIGLEALCAVNYLNPNVEDRFVHVIAHEYAHVQQAIHAPDVYGDPQPTVLEASLVEGAAEFTAKLISGAIANQDLYALVKGRRTAIETAFVADENSTDLSKWLYNGTLTKPGDLGYWVGYRIVKSYYQRAANKRKALREILEMDDPRKFLVRSGWHSGKVSTRPGKRG